jgi:hypothetical protein
MTVLTTLFGAQNAMTRIVLDAIMLEKLNYLTEPLELCDESGQVLGSLLPAGKTAHVDQTGPRISMEELQRRRLAKNNTRSTEVVLAYLGTL